MNKDILKEELEAEASGAIEERIKEEFKRKRRFRIKLTLFILLGIAVIAGAIVSYIVIRYTSYNKYRDYVKDYEYEEGAEFKAATDSHTDVEGMDLVAENDNLKLYADVETAYVAVYDKRTGQITRSNPEELENDVLANESNKNYMRSQLIVDYYTPSRVESTFDSYTYCVSREGQLEAESIKDGIRFKYTLGDLTASTGIVPEYMSQATLDEVTSKMQSADAEFFKKKYKESSVADDYLELLPAAKNGASTMRKMNKYLEDIGFTVEDYETEMLNSGVEGAVPISFVIPLEYRLLADSVEVSVPVKGIEELGGGAIHRLQILNFFGAASDKEEGYMLVPNGSGSIINFNNGKAQITSGNDYSEFEYGIDTLSAEYTDKEKTENVKLALFGIFRPEESILATIEDGASLANITANVAGEVNSYNNVYPIFVLRGSDKLAMFGTTGSEGELPVVEKTAYDSNLCVRFTFLPKDKSGYAGAAAYYRERLISEGKLAAADGSTGDIKFYYDVLGGVEETKYFLGTQYRGLMAMTTFDEAEEMAKDLKANGISNQVMNYQGWTKGGYYHDALSKVKVPAKLGGKKGLENLNSTVAGLGGTFYADVALQKVSAVASKYSFTNETSRYYGTGYLAEFGLVNPSTLRQTSGLSYKENIFYLVSPKFLVRYAEKFASKVEGMKLSGISLRDLGDELHSDKRRTNIINREHALDVVEAEFENLKATGKKLMVSDGNDYSFAYASDIINAPLESNEYYVIDYSIPFYEMLIHGSIDYSGSVINLGDTTDLNDTALKLISVGASPHFMFSWENANKLKDTGINRFYSTTYTTWKDRAVSVYKQVSGALSQVKGAYMTDYRELEPGVTVTTYSNGVKIYVNRSKETAVADGVSIAPGSYEIGE